MAKSVAWTIWNWALWVNTDLAVIPSWHDVAPRTQSPSTQGVWLGEKRTRLWMIHMYQWNLWQIGSIPQTDRLMISVGRKCQTGNVIYKDLVYRRFAWSWCMTRIKNITSAVVDMDRSKPEATGMYTWRIATINNILVSPYVHILSSVIRVRWD